MPLNPFTRLDHVQLAMPKGHEEEARQFYCDLLGMEEMTNQLRGMFSQMAGQKTQKRKLAIRAARPLLMVILHVDQPGFARFIDRRRKELAPFFLKALRP